MKKEESTVKEFLKTVREDFEKFSRVEWNGLKVVMLTDELVKELIDWFKWAEKKL